MTGGWIKNKLIDTGLFAGVEIYPVVLPQGVDNDKSIIYSRVDSYDQQVKTDTGPLAVERWSFLVSAKTLVDVRNLTNNVKSTFDNISDSSKNIQRMYFADISSDRYDEELELFSVNIDFFIRKIN